jgi:hypothetical protein
MNEAYEDLRNIDNRSFQPVKTAEHGVYNLWKGLASFEKLLQEDIRRQTNTIVMTTSIPGGADPSDHSARNKDKIKAIQDEQKEAGELTRLFTERFTQAVPPEGTPASGKLPGAPSAPLPAEDTETSSTNNAPQITRETRTNILHLAEQAVKTQSRANFFLATTNLAASLPEQRHSYDLLKEIEKLLPKDKNNQNDRENKDQQKQQQDQKQDPEQKDPKQDNQQQQNQPPQNEEKPPKQEEKPQQPKEQPSQPEEKEQKKDQKEMTPEQLRALLEKALQREKDHREEKTRDEYTPPSPVERDW